MRSRKENIRSGLRDLTPPVLLKIYRYLKGGSQPEYSGDYRSWQEAEDALNQLDSRHGSLQNSSGGYNQLNILERVRDARLKVMRGEYAYERDGVLFKKVEYFWPLLSALLWVASRGGNHLNIVDFGGSLGSTYFQNYEFLKHLSGLRWNIVEQESFVSAGRQVLSDNRHLAFYTDLARCKKESGANAIVLSSVLQYMENPYQLLRDVIDLDFEYIIFDRTLILESLPDRLTIQATPSRTYEAHLPAWFLNEKKFLELFKSRYELIADWRSSVGDPVTLDAGVIGRNKGYLFSRKG